MELEGRDQGHLEEENSKSMGSESQEISEEIQEDTENSEEEDKELMPKALGVDEMDEEDPAVQYLMQVRKEAKQLGEIFVASHKKVASKSTTQVQTAMKEKHEFLKASGDLLKKSKKEKDKRGFFWEVFNRETREHVESFKAVSLGNFENLREVLKETKENKSKLDDQVSEYESTIETRKCLLLKETKKLKKYSMFSEIINEKNKEKQLHPSLKIIGDLKGADMQTLWDWLADWVYDLDENELANGFQMGWVYHLLLGLETPLLGDTIGAMNEVLGMLIDQKGKMSQLGFENTMDYAAVCLNIILIMCYFDQQFKS